MKNRVYIGMMAVATGCLLSTGVAAADVSQTEDERLAQVQAEVAANQDTIEGLRSKLRLQRRTLKANEHEITDKGARIAELERQIQALEERLQ